MHPGRLVDPLNDLPSALSRGSARMTTARNTSVLYRAATFMHDSTLSHYHFASVQVYDQ